MSKKVLQIGTSLGLTISSDLLTKLGLKKGSRVSVTYNRKRESIEIQPEEKPAGPTALVNEVNELATKHADELRRIEDDW